MSESWSDGAGRTRKSRTPMTFDSSGAATAWSGSLTEYNILGQVRHSSVPTEINSGWTPSGDDAIYPNFLWMSHEYDWKGRPTKETNTDGTFKTISYTGCGCAGGQVTTIQGEVLTEGRRTQKIYADILGRTYKTETLNWDGSVYTTDKATFNGRDQIVLSRQFAGTESSFIFQDTISTFDGHGRLKTNHRPRQNAGTATTYNYFADGKVQQVIDARGATINYSYNNLGLVASIYNTTPDEVRIRVNPTATFIYDNLGNRVSMTDGLGTHTYQYNQNSQLMSEIRSFNDSMPNAPQANNSFKFEYSYTLSGQLKSYKEPYGLQVNYSQDKIGQLTSVTGNLAGNTTNYASNPNYTARGNLTHLDYGNGTSFQISGFNNKLQATSYELKHGSTSLLNKQYEFYDDGQLKKEKNLTNPDFDRLYVYDHQARMTQALTGMEANGQVAPPTPPVINSNTPTMHVPYHYEMQYNEFGNQTQTTTRRYISPTATGNQNYVNNRKLTSEGVPFPYYDAEGNVTYDEGWLRYNVMGQLQAKLDYQTDEPVWNYFYDGDGKMLKRTYFETIPEIGNVPEHIITQSSYSLFSSVLGEEITQADQTGIQSAGVYIRANGTTIAIHGGYNGVVWSHKDLNTTSIRSTLANGTLHFDNSGSETDRLELDPTGNSIGFDGYEYGNFGYTPPPDDFGGFPRFTGSHGETYALNGIKIPREYAMDLATSELYGYGGIFGLLERSAKRSAWVTVATRNGDWQRTYSNSGVIPANNRVGIEQGELVAYYTHNDWAINWSLFSWQTQQKQTTDLVPVPTNLKDKLKTRLDANGGKCRDFMNKLIGILLDGSKKIKSDAETIFDTISSISIDSALEGTEVGGTASFGKDYKRIISIRPPKGIYDSKIDQSQRDFYQEGYVSVLLHELLHHTNKNKQSISGHKNMAKAVNDTITADEKADIIKSLGKSWDEILKSKDGDYLLASKFATKAISKYCPEPEVKQASK